MRCSFWKREARMPEVERPPEGGSAARERAESDLEEVRDLWPEVHRVASSLRDLRRRNHFAEQIRAAMGVREQ